MRICQEVANIKDLLDYCTVREAIEGLEALEKTLPPEFDSFKISIETRYEYGNEFTAVVVEGYRDETDEEKEIRTGQIKVRERERFERVKREAQELGII